MKVLILFVFCAFKIVVIDGLQCSGYWVQGSPLEAVKPFRQLNISFYEPVSQEKLLKAACPVEMFGHNCFFLDQTERAAFLMRRRWDLTTDSLKSGCVPFSPQAFLKKFRNRSIYMNGDSTMNQLWQAIVCKLLMVTNVPETDFHIHWDVVKPPQPPHCVTGDAHCWLSNGNSVYFREYNITIYDEHLAHYIGQMPKFISEQPMKAEDIIIYNFGLHYDEPEGIIPAMQSFVNDTLSLREGKLGHTIAALAKRNLYFLESFPQNFVRDDGTVNGYFRNSEASDHCVALNNTAAHIDDRRDRLLDVHVEPFGIPVIRIADGLRSQYDAHIGLVDRAILAQPFADCTHYCNPSPVFDYIWTQIMNTVN